MVKLKTNDLFCGAGGMGLGFKNAGFDITGAWDFDKYAVQSYAHNVGDHVKQADISNMSYKDMPYADVWTFGFPCQDLSVAGKQSGMKLKCLSCNHEWQVTDVKENVCTECGSTDTKAASRSGLFFEVMRLLDESIENDVDKLPSIIMAENVKGLKPMLAVLENEYKERGYKMYYSLYNSKYWGVPQNRERYFVVGVHESIEKEFVFPMQQELYVPRLSTILENEVDEKYYISEEKTANIIEQAKKKVELKGTHAVITPDRLNKRQNGRRAKGEEEESYTCTAQDRHGVILKENLHKCIDDQGRKNKELKFRDISPTVKAEEHGNNKKIVVRVKEATKQGYAEATIGDAINISHPNSKTRRGRVGKQVAQTVLTSCEQVVVEPPKIMSLGNVNPSGKGMNGNVISAEGLCSTLTTNKGEGIKVGIDEIRESSGLLDPKKEGRTLRVGGKGSLTAKHNYEHFVTSEFKIRKLTPREYARLQGFPETFEFVVSDSQLYKQFGNAVTVNVAQAIAERIKMFLLSL